MKHAAAVTLILFAALLAAPSERAAAPARLRISYIGFADTLELKDGRLTHSFAQHSSMSRSAALQLTAEQEKLFADWVGKCRVLSLVRPDKLISDPNHPGAEERDSLLVEAGDRTIELFWTGVSRWNDPTREEALRKAIDELTKLSLRLIREAGLL